MRFKLNLWLLLLVTVVLVASSTFSYYALRTDLYARFEERKRERAERLQVNLENALWSFDAEQANSVINAEFHSLEVFDISIFKTIGQSNTLWISRSRGGSVEKKDEQAGNLLPEDVIKMPLRMSFGKTASAMIGGGDVELGYVQVSFSRQSVERLLAEQIRNRIAEILILNAVLALVLFSVMSRMVIAPLAKLSNAFKELARNPHAGEIEIKCEDEFGEVVNAFNQIERRLVSDIDRRIEAEKKLRESNKELTETLNTLELAQESLVQSEKFASLGSLVAGVAHEINTPVGVVVTGASFLLEETQKIGKLMDQGAIKKSEILQFIDSMKEGTQLVLSNAERAAHLIQSFKQVAADETSEARRNFNLSGYLNEVLTSLRPKYKKTRIKVGFSCPENLEMDSYPGLLTQVLSNLIVNALIHGYDEGGSGEVEVRAWQEGQWVNIDCFNDGKIIPAEHLPKIFDPFFTTRRSSGGTGLGLNIVFNIVTQRLGGTIKVSSKEGEGTKFSVRIPRVLGDKPNGVSNK